MDDYEQETARTKGNKDGHSTGGTSSSTWNSPPHFDPKIPDRVNTSSGGPTPSKILPRKDKNLKDKANSNKGKMNWASKFPSPLTLQLVKHQGTISTGLMRTKWNVEVLCALKLTKSKTQAQAQAQAHHPRNT